MLKFKPIFFPLLLVLITVLICFLNYTPNTFLTGWDTLHPEFNFSLNFQRLLSVWHPEQGLGDIPGHAQIADFPRVFILYLFHFILPLNFLRYSYIFLCFIIGPLGLYFLIKYIFQKNNHSSLIAFLSALLYIFNLSTLQQFYVPFEMFPTQWAFLPWIIFFTLKYLKNNQSKDLILFSIFTIFATPQAYAPQLWYAFFIIYFLFLTIHSFLNKNHFKKSLRLILFTLALNAFWLIPNIFYIITSSNTLQTNRGNRLYSQEYLLRNRQNGDLANTTLIKGFYFDWSAFNFDRHSFRPLMPVWQGYFNNNYIPAIGYSIFIFSLIGLIICFFKKDPLFISFTPFFIIPFVLLGNQIPIFSQFFDFLIQNSTLREAFRFIFTKLSILLLFGLVLFFAYFLNFIFQKIKPFFKYIISTLITLSLIIYLFPIFKGQLISPLVKINIPSEYFQFWQFMDRQNNGRILTLPLNQSTGWQYYDWGYQGSGFLWFNLKQSVLDRDSDRWNNKNEQSYQEFFNSLYSQNDDTFYNSLKKYRVQYIVWDQSVNSSSSNNNDQIIYKNEIDRLLKRLEDRQLLKKIDQFGSLYIYQSNFSTSPIEVKNISSFIQPSYQWGYIDSANSTDYVTTPNTTSTFYPFRDILDSYQKIDLSKLGLNQISADEWQITLKNSISLTVPGLNFTDQKKFKNTNTSDNYTLPLPELSHFSGYIIAFQSQYFSGLPLRFCLRNNYSFVCSIEDQLSKNKSLKWDYVLVPPTGNNFGYNLSLNNISFGNTVSESTLNQISIISIPFDLLNQVKYENNNQEPIDYLFYNQSFNPYWLAFYLDGLKPVFLQDHTLANNWANSWPLPQNVDPSQVHIIFWPQILEFIGLIILPITFWKLAKKNKQNPSVVKTTSPLD